MQTKTLKLTVFELDLIISSLIVNRRYAKDLPTLDNDLAKLIKKVKNVARYN